MKKFKWDDIGQYTSKRCFAYYGEELLGSLEYYHKWKNWVWEQGGDIIMSSSCLREVLKKLEELEGLNK